MATRPDAGGRTLLPLSVPSDYLLAKRTAAPAISVMIESEMWEIGITT
jgi:hypothetical protein